MHRFMDLNSNGTRRQPYVNYSPLDYPGCILWVAADLFNAASGAAVSSWTDMSGNANHFVQATGANQPVFTLNVKNGLPGIYFSGNPKSLASPLNNRSATYATVIGVVSLTGVTNGRMIAQTGTSPNWLLGFHGGYNSRFYFEGWVYPPGGTSPAFDSQAVVANKADIWSCVIGGAGINTRCYRNNFSIAVNTTGVAVPTALCLGTGYNYTEWSQGYVFEVIMFNRMLDENELMELISKLMIKYSCFS